jgi:WD40 repeat protein
MKKLNFKKLVNKNALGFGGTNPNSGTGAGYAGTKFKFGEIMGEMVTLTLNPNSNATPNLQPPYPNLQSPSPEPLHTLNLQGGGHTDSVFAVAFSPDGKEFVSASDDATLIVWDAVEG